jgi:hypothetical protein
MTDAHHFTRRDSRMRAIETALRHPRLTRPVVGRELRESLIQRLDGSETPMWSATVEQLAEAIFTALFGRPARPLPTSPLEQATDAKHRRDLSGEVGALMSGHAALRRAPWYPARPGDLVHIHYEQAGDIAAHGETYLVEPEPEALPVAGHQWLVLRLLHHTYAGPRPGGVTGAYATTFGGADPLAEVWMEAGPHRITVVRNGAVVHPQHQEGHTPDAQSR